MNVFKLQVHALAESTNKLLLLVTDEKAQGDCMGGWRVREAADDFSLGVFTVHKAPKRVHEHPHVRLPCFASPSTSVARCLPSPPRARFYSRQAQPPAPSTQNFIWFGLNECQWSYRKAHPGIAQQLCPPSRKDTQWRLPHANPLSLWTGLCASFRSKSTSHKCHSPVRVWKSLQPSGKKKIPWKNSEGGINWACSCLLYISNVTKFMLLHRIFFCTRDEQVKAERKPEQSVYSAHPWPCSYPAGDCVFCGTWHVSTLTSLLHRFCISVYYSEKFFPVFLFV